MAGLFSLLVGRTLRGRYQVERLISKGGMGAVFLAADAELERQVAVKVIAMEPQSPEEEASLRARFRREARAAARLQHPNVVTIYDVGSDEQTGLDFIVMELLRGEDLQQRLRRTGPLPPDLVVQVLHGAACGLGAGHREGLVHRDVKPANLFLEEGSPRHPPRVRVLDFGIAQVLENSAATVTKLTVYGGGPLSPPYAAPEQLRGLGTLTPACDVFALGCTAYELLTGALPFGEADRERMRRGDPVPPPPMDAAGIPDRLAAIIRRALSPHPRDRFADGDSFAEAIAFPDTPPRRPEVVEPFRPGETVAADETRLSADGGTEPVRHEPGETQVAAADTGPSIFAVTVRTVAVAAAIVVPFFLLVRPSPQPSDETFATDTTVLTDTIAATVAIPPGTQGGQIIDIRQITSPDGASGRFEPSYVYAHRGDVLRFVTDGKTVHNVSFPASENPGVALPPSTPYLTTPGQTSDVPIDLPPGTYHFQCDPHAAMGETGTLIVS